MLKAKRLLILPILALLAASTGIGIAFRRTIAKEHILNKGR